MTRPDASRYLVFVFCFAIVAAVFFSLLGIIVDPYRIFQTDFYFPAPSLKPRVYQQQLTAKIYMARRFPMNTVVLGNSRIEIGVDPKSKVWPASAKPVFNGGLAGSDLSGALILFREIVAKHSPKDMILGVDFQDFIDLGQRSSKSVVDSVLKTGPRTPIQTVADALNATLTLDAATDSIITLFDQDMRYGETMESNGFDPARPNLRENPKTLFEQKLADYQRRYAHYRASDFADSDKNAEFKYLFAILRICKQRKVQCTVVIYPYHFTYLEMLHKLGLWGSYENWKQALVKFVGRTFPSTKILDFSGYNDITTEAPPESNVPMKWYWEPGHFKTRTGDIIIAGVFYGGPDCRQLLPGNVEAEVESVRLERNNFLNKHAVSP